MLMNIQSKNKTSAMTLTVGPWATEQMISKNIAMAISTGLQETCWCTR